MPTDSSPTIVKLPERLDRSAALGLKEELDGLLGQNVAIDGSAAESVGGLGLQVLRFAKEHWKSSGWSFEITDASDPLAESLGWIGQDNTEHNGESEAWL